MVSFLIVYFCSPLFVVPFFKEDFSMTALNNDTSLSIQCQSEVSDGVLRYTSTVTRVISLPSDPNVLDLIVDDVEQIGQEMKRTIAVSSLEAVDRCHAQTVRKKFSLRHHGHRSFTLLTLFGRLRIQRTRLFDPKTGKTIIPSAIFWNTQQNRHAVSSLTASACEVSQELSYRKTQQHLSQVAGVDSLFSTSCGWNYKRRYGNQLEWSQQEFIKQGLKQHKPLLEKHGFLPPPPQTQPQTNKLNSPETAEEHQATPRKNTLSKNRSRNPFVKKRKQCIIISRRNLIRSKRRTEQKWKVKMKRNVNAKLKLNVKQKVKVKRSPLKILSLRSVMFLKT
jgi:hypothetical protein